MELQYNSVLKLIFCFVKRIFKIFSVSPLRCLNIPLEKLANVDKRTLNSNGIVDLAIF